MSKSIKIILIIVIIILIGGIIIFIFNNKNKKSNNNLKVITSVDKLTFGRYYKNNSKKLEPIEWILLDEKDSRKLLTTKNAIDSVPYNNELKNVTWDNSDIRKWLNNSFYNIAFNNEEKNKIVLTKNKALENPNHKDNTNIGNDTEDNIFLLSYQEVIKYFPNKNDRLLKPTKYAINNGCYVNDSGNVAWWTRSVGLTETSPEYLASAGDFGIREHQVNETIIGVRPAIWVKDGE